jgi:hypothetical protein
MNESNRASDSARGRLEKEAPVNLLSQRVDWLGDAQIESLNREEERSEGPGKVRCAFVTFLAVLSIMPAG